MGILPFPCTAMPLSANDFQGVVNALGTDSTTVWALLMVETNKTGYLPDRRPQILFERKYFHQYTFGQYDESDPRISAPTGGGYTRGAAEYERLGEAYDLSPGDALKSASWGIAQVMGDHFPMLGYATVEDYVRDSCASEAAQLRAFQNFVMRNNVDAPLRKHDWKTVAHLYNGGKINSPSVAKYSKALETQFNLLQNPAHIPDFNVRTAQTFLTYLWSAEDNDALNPSGVDGLMGDHTLAALHAFQDSQGTAQTNTIDDNVLAALEAALPAAPNLALQ